MDTNMVNKCRETNEIQACFSVITDEQKKYFDDNSNQVTYFKGETIFKQGTVNNSIMYIRRGLVKLSIQSNEKYIILSLKTKNHFVGFETFRHSEGSPYTVTALEDTDVTLVSKEVIANLLNQNRALSNEVIKLINNHVIVTYDRMFSLTQKQLHGRLADILLCLSRNIYASDTFELPLSRKDLAALTSMAPESVIRILKDFKTDNLINTIGKTIKLLNIPMLEKISAVG
ncbi:MAG: Crp/Fnr family transcriptional regulator [Bacteroidales bacterium]|nr:Crp/Fnr family transcriptional regulator [Bacteroidales bacterium]